jgi:hypothetical protein
MRDFDTHRGLITPVIGLFVLAALAAAPTMAVADDAPGPVVIAPTPPPVKPAAAPADSFPAQPPPVEQRGFFNDVGTWWGRSFSDFTAKMKVTRDKIDELNKKQGDVAKGAATATSDALKDAAKATQDAATAVVRLPATRFVELNERCAVAPNGAPDCGAAAANACRQKGFNSGQPIDIRTSQQCPAAVMRSGQTPPEGECPDETYILRAVCQ